VIRLRITAASSDRRLRATCRAFGSGSVETGSGIGPAGDRRHQRWRRDLEGEQSPWKERVASSWQRLSDTADSSVEKSLEVDRTA
jgi:hypothetical protein